MDRNGKTLESGQKEVKLARWRWQRRRTAKAASYTSPVSDAVTPESADTASLISIANSFCYVTANLWSWCIISVSVYIDMIGEVSMCTGLDGAECPFPFYPRLGGRSQKPSSIAHSSITITLTNLVSTTIINKLQNTDLSLIQLIHNIISSVTSRPWEFPIPRRELASLCPIIRPTASLFLTPRTF
jgi:hypothetical protein